MVAFDCGFLTQENAEEMSCVLGVCWTGGERERAVTRSHQQEIKIEEEEEEKRNA